MKHTKFKTNKLTTAAWTKAENHKTSRKGFMWGGFDGVDHVAREVLQHGVANRGSHPPAMGKALRQSTQHQVSVTPTIYRQDVTAAEKGTTATVENREANITRSRANLHIDATGSPGDDKLEKRRTLTYSLPVELLKPDYPTGKSVVLRHFHAILVRV